MPVSHKGAQMPNTAFYYPGGTRRHSVRRVGTNRPKWADTGVLVSGLRMGTTVSRKLCLETNKLTVLETLQ